MVLYSGRCLKVEGLKGLACLEGACVFLRPGGCDPIREVGVASGDA